MKLAILGVINPTINYYDWEKIFSHRFGNKTISEIGITGSESLLNSFVRQFATQNSIPISVYNATDASTGAKLARNCALIESAELLIIFAIRAFVREYRSFANTYSKEYGKKVLVMYADKSPQLNRRILKNKLIDTFVETKRDNLLTVDEGAALAMQIQNGRGDVDAAKEKLLQSSKRYVAAVAQRYVTAGHPLEVLISEGNKGIIHAAYKFNPLHGFKFNSYAIYWIRQFIEEAIVNY